MVLPSAWCRRASTGAFSVRRSRGASGRGRRWLERGRIFFPYFATGVRFDPGSAPPAPPVDGYFERLLDFAVASGWGRRPLARADSLAGATPSVAPLATLG